MHCLNDIIFLYKLFSFNEKLNELKKFVRFKADAYTCRHEHYLKEEKCKLDSTFHNHSRHFYGQYTASIRRNTSFFILAARYVVLHPRSEIHSSSSQPSMYNLRKQQTLEQLLTNENFIYPGTYSTSAI